MSPVTNFMRKPRAIEAVSRYWIHIPFNTATIMGRLTGADAYPGKSLTKTHILSEYVKLHQNISMVSLPLNIFKLSEK